MLPRLVILSDLWGKEKSAWIDFYVKRLTPFFDIEYYDCCALGNVNLEVDSQEEIHQQFVAFGIENAIQRLIQLEKERFHVLAFSIGGTIAWKAALLGLPLIALHAVSATRLRYEIIIPTVPTQLYFGMNDIYKPSQDWLHTFGKEKVELLNGEAHEMYQQENIATFICEKIIQAN